MEHAIQIKHLVLVEMPGFRPQFRRPFDVVGRPEELQGMVYDLLKQTESIGVEHVTASKIAPHINSFLRYSVHPQPAFPPPLGWNTPRYSFALEVEVKPVGMSVTQTLFVQGYTDACASAEQALAPESMLDHLDFHINSITTARTFYENTPQAGIQPLRQMVANQHLYSDTNFAGLFNAENVIESLRPADIFSRLAMDQMAQYSDMAKMVDTRTILSAAPRTSDRMNLNPAHMLAQILDAYIKATENARANTKQADLFEEARANVEETPAGMTPFLRELVGKRPAPASRVFRMEDLVRIDGSVRDRTTVVTGNNADKDLVHSSMYSDWNEESLEALIAHSVALNVPALLGKTGINSTVFTLEMMNATGQWHESGLNFSMIDLAGMTLFHDQRAKEEFTLELLSVFLPQWSSNYTIPLRLNVESNLNGLTVVDITLSNDSSKRKRFVMPTFMDGLVSPVLARKTDEASELATVAFGIGELLAMVSEKLPMA